MEQNVFIDTASKIDMEMVSLNHSLASVKFINANTGWAAGYCGTIIKTTDGGQNRIDQPRGNTSSLSGISFVNIKTGWAVGDNGVILRASNGGQNWSGQTVGLSFNLMVSLLPMPLSAERLAQGVTFPSINAAYLFPDSIFHNASIYSSGLLRL